MHSLLIAFLETEPRKSQLRWAFGMWSILTVLAVLLLLLLTIVVANRRARRLNAGGSRRRRRRFIPDAWAEAGRRVEPIRMDEPEPPTAEEPEDRDA